MHIKQSAVLKSLTMRSEKHGEDNEPAISMGFDVSVKPELLADLLETPDPNEVMTVFFKDDKHEPRLKGVKKIDFDSKIEGCLFKWMKFKLPNSTMSKFKCQPVAGGMIQLSFTVSSNAHPAGFVDEIHKHLQAESISIDVKPVDLFEQAENVA